MLGTLIGALEVRRVSLSADAVSADVEGVNELIDGIPVLTRLEIRYRLRVPIGSEPTVERALERHQSKCPSAQSLKNCVAIEWTAHIEEIDPERAESD